MGLMEKIVRVMWVPVLLCALYVGWVFWQRHSSTVESKSARVERDPLANYGKSVKILQFYAGAGEIASGQKLLLRYGVVNAAAVRLDPPAEAVWPAVSRCFDVRPTKLTR